MKRSRCTRLACSQQTLLTTRSATHVGLVQVWRSQYRMSPHIVAGLRGTMPSMIGCSHWSRAQLRRLGTLAESAIPEFQSAKSRGMSGSSSPILDIARSEGSGCRSDADPCRSLALTAPLDKPIRRTTSTRAVPASIHLTNNHRQQMSSEHHHETSSLLSTWSFSQTPRLARGLNPSPCCQPLCPRHLGRESRK